MLALDWPSPPLSAVSLDRAFSSTSRDAIILSTDISVLLCLRVVAKFLHDGGNFAIIHPATNLSGKAHLRSSSSLSHELVLLLYFYSPSFSHESSPLFTAHFLHRLHLIFF